MEGGTVTSSKILDVDVIADLRPQQQIQITSRFKKTDGIHPGKLLSIFLSTIVIDNKYRKDKIKVNDKSHDPISYIDIHTPVPSFVS